MTGPRGRRIGPLRLPRQASALCLCFVSGLSSQGLSAAPAAAPVPTPEFAPVPAPVPATSPVSQASKAPRPDPDASPQGLLAFLGKEVELELACGARAQGLLAEVGLCRMGLRLPGGDLAGYPRARVRKIRLAKPGARWHLDEPPILPCDDTGDDELFSAPPALSPPVSSPPSGQNCPLSCLERSSPGEPERVAGGTNANPPASSAPRRRPRVEWVGLRFLTGAQRPFFSAFELDSSSSYGWHQHFGFELVLFTYRSRWNYIEALRLGFGSIYFTYGCAAGLALTLDKARRHELRIGIHLTVYSLIIPFATGLQVSYILRVYKRFALEVGFMQFSYPTALALTFGLRI